MVRRKLARMSVTDQILSAYRRWTTSTECSAAVAVNQGKNGAFSTGSQSQ